MVPFLSFGWEKKPAHALVVQSTENPSETFCLIMFINVITYA